MFSENLMLFALWDRGYRKLLSPARWRCPGSCSGCSASQRPETKPCDPEPWRSLRTHRPVPLTCTQRTVGTLFPQRPGGVREEPLSRTWGRSWKNVKGNWHSVDQRDILMESNAEVKESWCSSHDNHYHNISLKLYERTIITKHAGW